MTTPIKIGVTSLILACSQLAEAQIFGQIGYGGTGCPDGTVTTSKSESRATLTFHLSDMTTTVGSQSGATLDRASCAVTIPVEVPAGKKIESIQAQYIGSAVVSELATLKINAEHFTAGSQGKVHKITLGATEGSSYALTSLSKIDSACGKAVVLRANFSQLAQTDAGDADLTAGVIDKAKYKVIFASCLTDQDSE